MDSLSELLKQHLLFLNENKWKNIELTEAQKQIAESIDITKYSCHLIKGITGSGKTEIYQEVAKKVIASGRQVLYIVPEISLTPQLIKRMSFRLGIEPSVFHYKLNDKLRKKHFIDFATGKSLFMLGARSALFIKVENDENSFKIYEKDKAKAYTIQSAFEMWETACNERFKNLKANEEELNRIFIDIYGLQDELNPYVEDKDITDRSVAKEKIPSDEDSSQSPYSTS